MPAMSRSCVVSIRPLIFGWEQTPESVSLHGGSPTKILREPDTGALLETNRGWVLLDTGSHPRMRVVVEFVPVTLPPVSLVIVSHLQYDHAGGLHTFADGKTPIVVQRAEFDFAFSPAATESLAYHRADYDLPGLQWQLIEGDVELLPGVRTMLTAGHTPGHQSLMVETQAGSRYVFACDAADLQENLDREVGVGEAIGVRPEETVSAIRRLKEAGGLVIPGHDPVVWQRLPVQLR